MVYLTSPEKKENIGRVMSVIGVTIRYMLVRRMLDRNTQLQMELVTKVHVQVVSMSRFAWRLTIRTGKDILKAMDSVVSHPPC